jgi:hypothetical protein
MSHLDRSLLAVTIRMSGTVAMPAKALKPAAEAGAPMLVAALGAKALILVWAEQPAERAPPASMVK